MQNGNYEILQMLKYTKRESFKSEDEMTNLGEYNFTQDITLHLYPY